ncbi:MAG: Rieske 2Fe-2S domain-containing protein, partial [Sphingomonadaceae bacterium]
MAQPSDQIIQAARKAGKAMADRNTPFVFDEWYVAAFKDEIGRALLPRTLLGKRIVFYRTEAGEPVALDDRCAHRSYPLSASTLQGDTIVCGYHGFRYDSAGNCVEVPSLKTCPRTIGVRRYPLVEIGPLVWIWMGDEDKADTARIPDVSYVDHPDWQCSKGYMSLPGNYVSLHENLLDLTHLSFVHAKSFGTPDYAAAPYKTEYGNGHFKVTREVNPTLLPPVWAEPSGLTGVGTAVRIATSEFLSPAYHRVSTSFCDGAVPEDQRQICSIRTAHLPTPETQTSTHYFIVHARDFALDQHEVTDVMHERLFAAFTEDVEALSILEVVLENTAEEDFYEISVASDDPGIA